MEAATGFEPVMEVLQSVQARFSWLVIICQTCR